MVGKNPKPYRSGNVLIHGLICCKNGCGYWNRDVNGATNIYKIAYNAINNKERSNYLSRSKNNSGFLEEFPKPKFTRSSLRVSKKVFNLWYWKRSLIFWYCLWNRHNNWLSIKYICGL